MDPESYLVYYMVLDEWLAEVNNCLAFTSCFENILLLLHRSSYAEEGTRCSARSAACAEGSGRGARACLGGLCARPVRCGRRTGTVRRCSLAQTEAWAP